VPSCTDVFSALKSYHCRCVIAADIQKRNFVHLRNLLSSTSGINFAVSQLIINYVIARAKSDVYFRLNFNVLIFRLSRRNYSNRSINLYICYNQLPPTTPINKICQPSFHPFVNFSVIFTVIAIMKCDFSLIFTRLVTKSDHTLLIFYSTFNNLG
jgi:hypothetical protein